MSNNKKKIFNIIYVVGKGRYWRNLKIHFPYFQSYHKIE